MRKNANIFADSEAFGSQCVVQAARQFYKKLTCVTVTKMGFVKCESERCLLIWENDIGTVILCIDVNEMLAVGNKEAIKAFKLEIKNFLNTKEEGPMEEYVGCKVVRKGNNEMHMFQPEIIHKLEKEFVIDVCEIRKYRTPAAPKFSVQRPTSNEVLILTET